MTEKVVAAMVMTAWQQRQRQMVETEAAEVTEAEECIRGSGMYQKHWKSMEADGADGAMVNTRCRRRSK
jgi:hypothetical protein